MNIELYGFAALSLIIVGLYFWQRVTATKLKNANRALAGVEALGLKQNKATIETDNRSARIKVNIDGKLKKTISDINASFDRVRDGSTGDLQLPRPLEIRPGSPEEGAIVRGSELFIGLAHKYEVLRAEMNAVKEWYRRETGG